MIDQLWLSAVDGGFAHMEYPKMTDADHLKLWKVQEDAPSCSTLLAERFTAPPAQQPVQRWWGKVQTP